MSQIELKVGEWYETRNGSRVKCVFDTRGIGRNATNDPIAVVCEEGEVEFYHPCGGYLYPNRTGRQDSLDIVKHLPGCTGWDWKPEKWRPAKPSDLDAGVAVPCRVRDATGNWITGRNLVGYNLIESFKFVVLCEDGYTTKWTSCEVRDE